MVDQTYVENYCAGPAEKFRTMFRSIINRMQCIADGILYTVKVSIVMWTKDLSAHLFDRAPGYIRFNQIVIEMTFYRIVNCEKFTPNARVYIQFYAEHSALWENMCRDCCIRNNACLAEFGHGIILAFVVFKKKRESRSRSNFESVVCFVSKCLRSRKWNIFSLGKMSKAAN